MTNLSSQIKEGTKKSHTMAENTGFITCFLKGVVEKKSYVKLMSDLYHVYSAMEDEFERHKERPILNKIYYPELFRKKSIEKDLEYYLGSDWESKVTQTSSCKRYVERIREVSNKNRDLLISHHYTRYIGDLSGGQILKKIAQTALKVGDEGLNFYTFNDISDEKEFKNNYRSRLDSIPFNQKEIDDIIEEANNAFHYNMDVFNEIEGNLISAIGKVLFSTLTRHQRRGSTENG
jgi:heme oxygenase